VEPSLDTTTTTTGGTPDISLSLEGEAVLPDQDGGLIRLGPAALTGAAVSGAEARFASAVGWEVTISFRGDGSEQWSALTGEAACAPPDDPKRRVAIVLDREVISSPQVSPEIVCGEGITGGETVITGRFGERDAKDLALLVRAGALPVPVEVVERRTIGPTLGDAAIRASVEAAILGAALTIAYMVAYYRLLGALAAAALLVYALVSFAVLLALDATLTLPGVAGFVLAVGMAVDANVLVFERIREELRAGKTPASAIEAGFSKAVLTIVDSNATTVIAAFFLFLFGTGPVKGFAVTLTIGLVANMFTAVFVSRFMFDYLLSRQPRQAAISIG
ncbi:MAG: protein translocase subunit SecD, partial [bacterium]